MGVCEGELRLLPLSVPEELVVAEELVVVEDWSDEELVLDPLDEPVVCALDAVVCGCWAAYSCAATAVTAPVSPTAPAIIRFVAEEASLSPACRRPTSCLFMVSGVSRPRAREH